MLGKLSCLADCFSAQRNLLVWAFQAHQPVVIDTK